MTSSAPRLPLFRGFETLSLKVVWAWTVGRSRLNPRGRRQALPTSVQDDGAGILGIVDGRVSNEDKRSGSVEASGQEDDSAEAEAHG